MGLFYEIADAINNQTRRLELRLFELEAVARQQAASLQQIVELLKRAISRPPNPGPIAFVDATEGEGNMIQGNVLLPDVTALTQKEQDEIASGRLRLTTPDGNVSVLDTDKTLRKSPVEGEQGTLTHAHFVWVDNAGNESKVPAELDINFVDDVPPVDPSALGFESTGEV